MRTRTLFAAVIAIVSLGLLGLPSRGTPGAAATSAAALAGVPVIYEAELAQHSTPNPAPETTWPGYTGTGSLGAWKGQGQYIRFTINTPTTGQHTLTFRYTAADTTDTRTLLINNTPTTITFPKTTTWNTWQNLTTTANLNTGTNTIELQYTTNSTTWINLDNLTITPPTTTTTTAPPTTTSTAGTTTTTTTLQGGVIVAVGYADGASGLSPWSGSANTTFIGSTPQCCMTHGPDNGKSGWDAGAILVTNQRASAVTLNNVTVDFRGLSVPSHFAIWGGALPTIVPPGGNVVLTMTLPFNFDSSDLNGEACHFNTGVVPVVHVTVNGASTDYYDSHQVLNSDGVDPASCPDDVFEQVPFSALLPGTQPNASPVNDILPALTGPPIVGRVMSGLAGAFNASPPPTTSGRWMRCNASGANCGPIGGATTETYRPSPTDVGSTLRYEVTASNSSGTITSMSNPSAVVQTGPSVTQFGNTSTGFTSVVAWYNYFVPTEFSSAFTAPSSGTAIDFTFYARGAGDTQGFTPSLYSVVNGSRGALLARGSAVSVPRGANGRWYVSPLAGVQINGGTKYMLVLQSDMKGSTYVGSENDGTMSFFIDYA